MSSHFTSWSCYSKQIKWPNFFNGFCDKVTNLLKQCLTLLTCCQRILMWEGHLAIFSSTTDLDIKWRFERKTLFQAPNKVTSFHKGFTLSQRAGMSAAGMVFTHEPCLCPSSFLVFSSFHCGLKLHLMKHQK